uniref:DUF418 domain-containing protein n=1 Tax=Pedobacter sp. FW305-3-2-15-E-R2A2 TaxID=3140251 RepID=UPI00406CF547
MSCFLQLWIRPLWQNQPCYRFLYGPIEWLWRSLTYGKKTPIKINAIQKQKMV